MPNFLSVILLNSASTEEYELKKMKTNAVIMLTTTLVKIYLYLSMRQYTSTLNVRMMMMVVLNFISHHLIEISMMSTIAQTFGQKHHEQK